MPVHGCAPSAFHARARYRTPLLAALCMACAVFASAQAAPAVDARAAAVQAAIRAKDLDALRAAAARFDAETSTAARGWIVRGLGALDPAGGMPVFEKALGDADPQVRADAAAALGAAGGAQAAADLAAALAAEKNPGVRQTIAFWLGSFKDAASTRALGQALKGDADANVRIQSAHSLKRAGTREARKQLKQADGDDDERVRQAAHE